MVRQDVTRRGFLAMAGAAALTGRAVAAEAEARPIRYVDSLLTLPEDLADFGRAGLSALICDVSNGQGVYNEDGTPDYFRTYDGNIDRTVTRLAGSADAFVARRGSDIGSRPGCAIVMQMQTTTPIGTDLSRIARFHGKGLRVLQFTHHRDEPFAGGALERVQSGLTPLGIDGLAEMNRLRIVPDVAHGSVPTMVEAAQRSATPIVLSHGAARAIVDNPRCAPDTAIRAIAEKGGVIGIFMLSFWLTPDPVPTVDHLLAHIRHVARIGGIDAVGIANDFSLAGHNVDAAFVQGYREWWVAMRDEGLPGFDAPLRHVVIPELNRIDRMARIHAALERDGFRAGEIEKIMGGNWTRVLIDVLG
ncbi:membrane dipeptidase [Sphingosinicella sp. LHD-64]|uniref:membrane dipeptidase n=1 Tax=Sphingosinicella sp. LHD-64 TaxID=3072139 RepID=UPI00280E4B61|nr:membrane dipeptidase [Sphingosinicella sp. LHD-64]MDQ8756472.1 membrane dipeptidase [Sphingosinicella sp. LHD-64]